MSHQRTLQAVVIPKMESRVVETSDLMRRASSRTSFRTSSSSSTGEPAGHETPDTSTVNTPGTDLNLQMGPVNNKRKRSSALSTNSVNDTSADADLVRLLRDEECAGPSHIRSNQKVSIDLTADSESEPLSPPISVSFFSWFLQTSKLKVTEKLSSSIKALHFGNFQADLKRPQICLRLPLQVLLPYKSCSFFDIMCLV